MKIEDFLAVGLSLPLLHNSNRHSPIAGLLSAQSALQRWINFLTFACTVSQFPVLIDSSPKGEIPTPNAAAPARHYISTYWRRIFYYFGMMN
jgi:hypothetical protein